MTTTTLDITTQTPVEIDTALADLFDQRYRIAAHGVLLRTRAFSHAKRREVDAKPSRWDTNPTATYDEVLALLQEKSGHYAASLLEDIAANRADYAANTAAQAPLHAEFTRRGGWSRAFLCTAAGGHVHSSQNCSTCFLTTQYAWLPSLSGQDEAEIVAAAGSDACTVCYPSAPVEVLSRPRSVFSGEEITAQQARDERAAAKAERDAKKAAKALEIDLRPFGLTHYDARIHTLAAAKSYLTNAAEWGTHPYYPAEAVQFVAEAIAAKVGTSAEQEIAAAAKRAAKRR